MNKEEMKALMPHREAMLLLDEIAEEDGLAKAKCRIRGDEWFLQGHFPDNPVVPGVILCEMLAQTVSILTASEERKGATPYFTGLNNVRFRGMVKPGDLFETECRIVKEKAPFVFAEGKGRVAGKLCVSAEFSFILQAE